jgi:hypothetical protein
MTDWEQDFLKEPDKLRQAWVDTSKGRFLVGELWAQQYLAHRFTYKVASFHREIWNRLCFNERVCIAIFRGSGKSEVMRHYVLFCLLNGIFRDILILSKTADLAISEWSTKIGVELVHNQGITKDYGNLIFPFERYTQDEIVLANGWKITFKGMGYPIRGFRYDLVVFDDPETFEAVQSESARTMLEGFFSQDLSNALALGRNQVVVLGNIFNRLCLVNKITTRVDGKFGNYVSYAPAAESKDENGERIPLWPAAWPIEKLDAKLREIAWAAYQCEYMNNPTSSDDALIKEESLKWYDQLPAGKYICWIGIDPAGAAVESNRNKNRDYSAIAIWFSEILPIQDKDEDLRKFYHWYGIRFKKQLPDVARMVMDLYLDYRSRYPTYIVAEQHGMRNVIEELELHARRRDIPLQGVLKSVTHGAKTGDLTSRVSKLLGLFEYGKIFFRPQHKNLIYEELLSFDKGDHDDWVSACELCLTEAKNKRFASFNQPINYARLYSRPQPGTGKLMRVG